MSFKKDKTKNQEKQSDVRCEKVECSTWGFRELQLSYTALKYGCEYGHGTEYSMQYVPLWRALACVIDKLMIHSQ